MSEPAGEYAYAVEYLAEVGRWVRLFTFPDPLSADRFYELVRGAGRARPLQVVRFKIITRSEQPEEG